LHEAVGVGGLGSITHFIDESVLLVKVLPKRYKCFYERLKMEIRSDKFENTHGCENINDLCVVRHDP